MIDRTSIEKIEEMTLAGEPPVIIDDDRIFYRGREILDPTEPSALSTATLGGFTAAAGACLGVQKVLFGVSVGSPTSVVLFKNPDRHGRRELLATCTCPPRTEFPFESWMQQDDFMTMAQACFVDTKEMRNVLKVIGTLKAGLVTTYEDDGTTQQVATAAGVERAVNAEVPNPVVLNPYRTFLEIDQPESQFVLRLRDAGEGKKPLMGLYEVVDGEWMRTAMVDLASEIDARFKEAGITVPIFV